MLSGKLLRVYFRPGLQYVNPANSVTFDSGSSSFQWPRSKQKIRGETRTPARSLNTHWSLSVGINQFLSRWTRWGRSSLLSGGESFTPPAFLLILPPLHFWPKTQRCWGDLTWIHSACLAPCSAPRALTPLSWRDGGASHSLLLRMSLLFYPAGFKPHDRRRGGVGDVGNTSHRFRSRNKELSFFFFFFKGNSKYLSHY